MILYLAGKVHTNLLDFMEGQGDDTLPVKKMVGSFLLKQFILYDMRNFSHFGEIILDRQAFRDNDAEFGEAIEEFLTMYTARITVIYEGLEQGNLLFQKLLDIGVGNIVTSPDIYQMQSEIRQSLSKEGMTTYHAKERVMPGGTEEHYQFSSENIHIGMIAGMPRMGVTTAAMGLANWLCSVGAKAAYVEENASRHLNAIAKAYEMEETEEGFRLENVDYLKQKSGHPYHFQIHDIGSLYEGREADVATMDQLVIMCGVKPYELPYGLQVIQKYEKTKATILCPFVADNIREIYAELNTEYHTLLFMEYQPDFMDGSVNAEAFRKIVESYIAGV